MKLTDLGIPVVDAVHPDDKENLGEASMLIELKDNMITVHHGTDKSLLFTKKSKKDTWENIWKAIKND